MRLWPNSLQGQLALRLALVFFVVSAAGTGLLLWEGSEAADNFGLEILRYRTGELAQHLSREPNGRVVLKLPPALARLYDKGSNLYAIKTSSGQMLASGKEIADQFADIALDGLR